MVKLSERNDVNFEIISCLPSFYREILCCFNNCKKNLNTINLSNAEFIQQPLWNNEMFKYNGQKRWSQSNILYVKDLFGEHGNFCSLQQLCHIVLTLRFRQKDCFSFILVKNLLLIKDANSFMITCCKEDLKILLSECAE